MYRLTFQKRIPFVKVGGTVRFIESWLIEWLEGNAIEPQGMNMNREQSELFPELDKKQDMEQEVRASSGLSIVPYLTANTGKVENRNAYKSLSSAQREHLRNVEVYERLSRYEAICKSFENQHGYPFSWRMFELLPHLKRERGEITYQLEVSANSLILKRKVYLPPIRRNYSQRDVITDYSMKSRKRFFEKLLLIRWDSIPLDTIRELTLTYPAIYPEDGIVLKTHLDIFSKRLRRFGKKYGNIAFAWKIEFQRRGAPHFHLILISESPIPLEDLRTWALCAWSEMTAKWITELEGYSDDAKQDAIEKHRKVNILVR